MNKKELTELIKNVSAHYGEMVKCEWFSPYGSEWIGTEKVVNGYFITELERGCIKNVVSRTAARELEELKKAAAPLIKWLCENHHPHVTAIVTPTSVEVLEGVVSARNINDYIVD